VDRLYDSSCIDRRHIVPPRREASNSSCRCPVMVGSARPMTLLNVTILWF